MLKNRKIREAKFEDIKRISNINRLCRQENFKGLIKDTVIENFTANKAYNNREGFFNKDSSKTYVLYDEHKIIGYCALTKHDGEKHEIYALYIDPKYQGMGNGGFILSYILDNYSSQEIFLRSLKNNINTNKFYEKYGGILVGEKEILFGGERNKVIQYKR